MAKAYAEILLKDENPSDDSSDSLYRVFTLSIKGYTETLLKDESLPDRSL